MAISQIIAEMKPWNLSSMNWPCPDLTTLSSNEALSEMSIVLLRGQFVILVIIGDDGLPNISSFTVGDLEVRDKRFNETVSARRIHLRAERLFPSELANETPTFDFSANIQDLLLTKRLQPPIGPQN